MSDESPKEQPEQKDPGGQRRDGSHHADHHARAKNSTQDGQAMSDKNPKEQPEQKDALTSARELIQADKDHRRDTFGKALAELCKEHRCELVAMVSQPQVTPDGTLVVPPPTVGIRVLN